ncbi:MAG TPA: NAD-dependent epimerase/dehydratase family protein [Candidatus Thermoplasmatota archaeon]|nr:NAD-dependent epimerase/dehydratase family protein [Candidatus Thermoplasmatota archaeon]
MAKVVLTGATGVLGRHTHRALSALGHDVTATSRLARQGAGWAQADLSTGHGVAAAVREAEAIVHCATDILRTAGTDRAGLHRLREAAPEARIVYPSIVGVDRVAFPYYKQKLAVEQDLVEGEHVILRLTQFHEFPHQLASLPVMMVPNGFRTQPIAAHEAGALLAACVDGPSGRRPDAGGPEVHDLKTLLRRVAEARGRRMPVLEVPMPGSSGFKAGLNLCEDRKVGRQTWDEHFRDWLDSGMPDLS